MKNKKDVDRLVKDMPLLSIITVCRNDVARLRKTVNSLASFYDDERFEHIVVDGNSSDKTNVLVEPLLRKKNFRFYSDKDSGIYDAMNRGASYSLSPYLLFLNCGDIMVLSPDELFDHLFPLVAGETASLDIACFPVRQVGIEKSRTLAPARLLSHKMPVSHQGMVFSREFLWVKKYCSGYRIAADYDVYLQARRIAIVSHDVSRPLTAVEVDGVASGNPLAAYREYLSIARFRLTGYRRLVTMIRIGLRALSIIVLKQVVPGRWISKIRGV